MKIMKYLDNFGLYDFGGFYAIIRRFEETNIWYNKMLWWLLGIPQNYQFLVQKNREFQVGCTKESTTRQVKLLHKSSFPIISRLYYFCSCILFSNYEPINNIKLIGLDDEFINVQISHNKSNTIISI